MLQPRHSHMFIKLKKNKLKNEGSEESESLL